MSELTAWLSRITQGDTPRQIAEKVPYSYSTVARWIKADDIPCEAVVQIARAYQANVLEALVSAKHITQGESELGVRTMDVVASVPTRMLVDELTRRLQAYERTLVRS